MRIKFSTVGQMQNRDWIADLGAVPREGELVATGLDDDSEAALYVRTVVWHAEGPDPWVYVVLGERRPV